MGYDMKRSFNYINISYINQIWIFNINQLPLLYYIFVKIFEVLPSSYWGLLSIPLPTLNILLHDRVFCSSLIVSLCPLIFPSKLFFLAYQTLSVTFNIMKYQFYKKDKESIHKVP